jgi:hypothetical protein
MMIIFLHEIGKNEPSDPNQKLFEKDARVDTLEFHMNYKNSRDRFGHVHTNSVRLPHRLDPGISTFRRFPLAFGVFLNQEKFGNLDRLSI